MTFHEKILLFPSDFIKNIERAQQIDVSAYYDDPEADERNREAKKKLVAVRKEINELKEIRDAQQARMKRLRGNTVPLPTQI
ncbi:hypothetical protein DM02DRAFT_613766 [Periconia macrospinosa]|uniref:Uncharacterized protein n=1 Tax=Periconia macrospinosa TaxID=97972 RepID=A0A2V1DT05_9PLEO|nr:hypothetical protein DM02DRAFT_613766 [Periconia macrospinosa]